MAKVFWTGNAQNQAMVDTITVTAVAASGTLTATINGSNVTYTCSGSDTVATAVVAWLALLVEAQSQIPEFGQITFTSPTSTTITATANNAGQPFVMTKSQSGGATCTLATTTANISSNDATNANNWLRSGSAALPQNGDDVIIANSSVPILYNIDSFGSILLNSFTRYQSFTGTIGLPENNPNGYYEYLPTYLQLGSNVASLPVVLGVGSGQGPSRERYNVNAYQASVNVIASGTPVDAYAIRFLGSNTVNTITVLGTTVGVAMLPGETASLNLATVDGGGTLDLGQGCSITGTGGGGTFTMRSGTSTLYCTPAAIVATNSASVTLSATSGTYSSLSCVNGVSVTLTQPMTITTLVLAKSSNLDNSGNLGAVTITNSTIDGDTCQINDPNNGITFTQPTSVLGQVSSGPIIFTGPRTLKLT